jgi:xanthine dehydrogenase YagS FAD-binding subunit
LALAAAAVALKMDASKKVSLARVAMGHVAPVPWNATEAAEFLVGKTITEDVAAEAGRLAVAKASALARNAYKIQLAQVAVKRALLQAAG